MDTQHRMSVTVYKRLKSYTMIELHIYSTEGLKVFYLFLTHLWKIKKKKLFWIGCIKVHENLW
jgi:hypothetical protein